MNTNIFQVKSNKQTPYTGCLLLASPLLSDYHLHVQSFLQLLTPRKKVWESS